MQRPFYCQTWTLHFYIERQIPRWPIDKFSVKNVWETLKFILVFVKTYWKVWEFLHRYMHKSRIFHSHNALKQFQCFKKRKGSLSNNDGQRLRKRHTDFKKVNWRCLQLYRAYSISFNSSNVGKFFWSWILKDCIKVKGKKEKVVVLCSRPRRNVKLATFTS